MYCNILTNMYNHDLFKEYNLSLLNLKQFHEFLFDGVSTIERGNINPLSFCYDKNVSVGTAFRVFNLAAVCRLVNAKFIFSCPVCDTLSILDDSFRPKCKCNDLNICSREEIAEYTYIFFELLFDPENCSIFENEYSYDDFFHSASRNIENTLSHFESQVGNTAISKNIEEKWASKL